MDEAKASAESQITALKYVLFTQTKYTITGFTHNVGLQYIPH